MLYKGKINPKWKLLLRNCKDNKKILRMLEIFIILIHWNQRKNREDSHYKIKSPTQKFYCPGKTIQLSSLRDFRALKYLKRVP